MGQQENVEIVNSPRSEFVGELTDFTPKYLELVSEDCYRLKSALELKDKAGVAKIVCRVLGSACSYGLAPIDSLIEQIQDFSKKGDFQEALIYMKSLETYLTIVGNALGVRSRFIK